MSNKPRMRHSMSRYLVVVCDLDNPADSTHHVVNAVSPHKAVIKAIDCDVELDNVNASFDTYTSEDGSSSILVWLH